MKRTKTANRRPVCFFLCTLCFFLLSVVPVTGQESAGEESTGEENTGEDDYFDFGEAGGIIVTGKPDTTAQVKTIAKDEIDRIAAPDIPTLLEEALDISITRHGAYGNSSEVNIRGFDTERIAILVDGVPVNSAMSGDFDFNTIDMNNIERIEVIYGGSDSKYNVTGALGGVINIVTIKDRPQGFRIGAGLTNFSYMPGSYTEWSGIRQDAQPLDLLDTQKLEFSLSYGSQNVSLGAHFYGNRAQNHYLYKDSFLGQVRRKQHNEVWDAGGGVLLNWKVADLSKLIFSVDTYYSDKNIPATGFSSVIGVQNDVTLRESVMFEAPVFIRDDISMEAVLSHSWARMDYDRGGMPFSRHDQNGFSFINRWGWYPFDWLTLRAGGDYRYVRIASTAIGVKDRHDGGLYLTVEYSPHRALKLAPSIKAVSDGGAVVAAPKFGVIWEPLDVLTVKNNYFRSFKYPDFDDLYWRGGMSVGNPDLLPEDGWGADLGAELRVGVFTVESTFFAQYTVDSIHWHRAAGGYWEPENIGEAALFGSDTRVKAVFPVSWGPVKSISPSLSYQYLHTWLLSYGYTWEDEKRIPYQPMHMAGAQVDVSWGSGSFVLSAHYESVRYYSTTNMIELDPYLLLNAHVNQALGEQVTVFTALRNLRNQSYESYNRYPMPAFNVTMGVRFNAGL
jgi:vitamin B12 transporter